jgi:catechol 2,3-dioxygenase-like lactoylglutathione lyase family enzyme
MIGYVTIGTNDFPRASRYYDELLGALNAKRTMGDGEKWIAWSTAADRPSVCLVKPFDGKPASVGNGSMVALSVATPADVDRVHALALRLGSKDEGAAGPRGDMFYAGYFRDLDGNKLNVFCIVQK